MVNRLRISGILALVALAVDSAESRAQPAVPGARSPTVSPNLNLLRQGNSQALNYFGLVRPEFNAMQSIQNVQASVAGNQRSINELYNGGGLAPTGVSAQFLNYRSYFLTQNSGGFGGGIGVGANSGIRSGGTGANTVGSGRR